MSHELRTPLNAVIGFSEVLLERMFGELNERQEEYLRDIPTRASTCWSCSTTILDLSKVEAGRMELDLTDVRRAGRCSSTRSSMVRERAAAHGIDAACSSVDPASGWSRPTSCGSSRCCSTCSATP